MKYARLGFLSMLLGLVMLGGCQLSAESQKRIDDLVAENEALALKQQDLLKRVKEGTAKPEEVAAALEAITAQMKKNVEEVKAIRDSGTSTAAIIGAVAGTIGRSALHALAASVPGGNALGSGLQMLLTLLLGGSQTKKAEEAPAK